MWMCGQMNSCKNIIFIEMTENYILIFLKFMTAKA